MPVINEQRLLELVKANPRKLLELPMSHEPAPFNLAQAMLGAAHNIDLDSIRAMLAAIRYELVENQRQQGKGQRPWTIDPQLYARLDRTQPWWGWEFELGYKNAAAYAEGVGYAYDNFEGAMFDGEGEGRHPVEITFIPEEASKFADGTSQAHRFMLWTAENAARISDIGVENNVGSHLNMSDPRMVDKATTMAVANFMNRTLQHTRKVNGQRKTMFGRESIYAGFFSQQSGNNHWMEFKGFRTTYDAAEWGRYVQVSAALQKCIDLYFELRAAGPVNRFLGVNNLFDVAFNDAVPTTDTFQNRVVDKGASKLSTRFGENDPDGLGRADLL